MPNNKRHAMVLSGVFDWLRQTPVTLVLSALVVCVFSWETLHPLLEINFREPHGFSLMQLMGCHLLHYSPSHLFWDLGMFAALGLLCEKSMSTRFTITVLATAIVVPYAVLVSNPNIDVYRGLSGIDTALFSLFATRRLVEGWASNDRYRVGIHAGLLALLLCKTVFELTTGSNLFVEESGFTPVPVAHLVGIAIGFASGCIDVRSLEGPARRLAGLSKAGLSEDSDQAPSKAITVISE